MVHMRRGMVPAALVVAGLLVAGNAHAQQSKCLASKNKCVSKKATALLKCHQKAETPGKVPDPNAAGCLDKAMAKFDGGIDPTKGCFEKLENKVGNDCLTFDDTAALEAQVDACIDLLVEEVDPAPLDQSKCGVGKKKCIDKKMKGLLKCHQKAQTPGKDPNPNANDCIDKVILKFEGTTPATSCFGKLEAKVGNDCALTGGTTASVEALIDACVDNLLQALATPTTTTTSTVVPTTTTTTTTLATTTTSTTVATTTTTTTTVPVTTTTTTVPVTTTTTSTTTTTTIVTTTTSTTTTSTTTTTAPPAAPTSMDFTTTTGSGQCGVALNATAGVERVLTCGGLSIGGGFSSVLESQTPDGGTNRFTLSCAGSSCTIGPSLAPTGPLNTIGCTNTGCAFGPPVAIPNFGTSSCVINTFAQPASGNIDLSTGVTTNLGIQLTSTTYITGNNTQPCPKCVTAIPGTAASPQTGTCDRGARAGLSCVTTNSQGLSGDCQPQAGQADPGNGQITQLAGNLAIALGPLTTGQKLFAEAAGRFCPGQTSNAGCFGRPMCRSIEENGSPAGPLTVGSPSNVILASTFCIPASTSALLNTGASLPGPGATTLVGTLTPNL